MCISAALLGTLYSRCMKLAPVAGRLLVLRTLSICHVLLVEIPT
jgi:hypothetical protein